MYDGRMSKRQQAVESKTTILLTKLKSLGLMLWWIMFIITLLTVFGDIVPYFSDKIEALPASASPWLKAFIKIIPSWLLLSGLGYASYQLYHVTRMIMGGKE